MNYYHLKNVLLLYTILYCFLNIMFRHNMSFTYTSKNVLLKIGIIFSLFFGLDNHRFLSIQSQCGQ